MRPTSHAVKHLESDLDGCIPHIPEIIFTQMVLIKNCGTIKRNGSKTDRNNDILTRQPMFCEPLVSWIKYATKGNGKSGPNELTRLPKGIEAKGGDPKQFRWICTSGCRRF